MCNCINVDIGSYKNQFRLKIPNHMVTHKTNTNSLYIGVDACLIDEIIYLWRLGIRTTGCCCGHNKVKGFIGVLFDDITKMKKLGYNVKFNECRPNDEDSFIPKSL